MRPTARPQSALRAPLNAILGTEGNVRVLRVLADLRTPISAPELARRAMLQRSSVHRALKALEESGVIEFVGTAPHAQVALRERSPLAHPLRELYSAEGARYEDLLSGLKRAAATVTPPPLSVWVEGGAALGVDRPGDPVTVCVLDNARAVDKAAESMRDAVESLEGKLEVPIAVSARTLADLDVMPRESRHMLKLAIPLLGVPPEGLLAREGQPSQRNIRSHAYHDARALALGRELADAIRRDPSLVEGARKYLARRWREASAGERQELAEWKRILRTATPAQLRKLLVDPGERAARLRQTLPFLGVLAAKR